MFVNETPLARVVDVIEGKQVGAGEACGVTPSIIGRWIRQKHLPRTEYTGETDYAARLANASQKARAQRPFTAAWLKANAAPGRTQ